MVPTMFALLAKYLETNPADLSCVKIVGYGAAAITTTLLHQAMDTFPSASFLQGYGQTELSASATTLGPEFHSRDSEFEPFLRSAGVANPLVDIKICDADLNPVPIGHVGEVLVQSPGRMLGYWNQPELTAQTIVEGWVRTGDAGYLDDRGFLYIVDRIKDMIISGGENVYSAEVENAISQHSAVQEVAVVGIPDERWGERVHAVIRLHSGALTTPEQIIKHTRDLIAGYKIPRSIEFITEPLPTTGAGKVSKVELRRIISRRVRSG